MDTIAFGVGVRKVCWPDAYNRKAAPTATSVGRSVLTTTQNEVGKIVLDDAILTEGIGVDCRGGYHPLRIKVSKSRRERTFAQSRQSLSVGRNVAL